MRNGGFKIFCLVLGAFCCMSSISQAALSNGLNSIKACSTCAAKTSDCSRVSIIHRNESQLTSCCSPKVSESTSRRQTAKHNSRRRK